MTAAAVVVAAFLQPGFATMERQFSKFHRMLAAAVVVGALAGLNAHDYVRRVDSHEREYYALSRMHYELVARQLQITQNGRSNPPTAAPPKSLGSNIQSEDYLQATRFLMRFDSRWQTGNAAPRPEASVDGWDAVVE